MCLLRLILPLPEIASQVYVHKPGSEFWLSMFLFPYTLTTFKLESSTKDRYKAADLHLEEVDSIHARACDPHIR